jgi:hypothetical protein
MRRRRWILRLAALLVLAGIAAYVADRFADAHRELREETAAVDAGAVRTAAARADLERVLARTDAELTRLRDTHTVTRAQRVAQGRELERVYGELVGLNEELEQLVNTGELQVLTMAVTKECLLGVEVAIEQVALNSLASIRLLEEVRAPCEQANRAANEGGETS